MKNGWPMVALGEFAKSIYAINLTDFNERSLMKAINDVS